MPIYEYRCENCGKITEILHMRNDNDVFVICRYCGSRRLEKLISAPASVVTGRSIHKGKTCCDRDEWCDSPPCSNDGTCKRD